MAVIKTGNTTQLVQELYAKINDAMQVSDQVKDSVQNAVEQLTAPDIGTGIANKVVISANNANLTQTLKGVSSQDTPDGKVDGTHKITLTGTDLTADLTTGNITGVATSSSTTMTEKGPAYLGTETVADSLTAKVTLDLAQPGNLTVGNFTSTESEKNTQAGYKLSGMGQLLDGRTFTDSATDKTTFTGDAVYVNGALSSGTIKSVSTSSSYTATSDGDQNSQTIENSVSDSLVLSSKQGLSFDTSGLKGDINNLTYSHKTNTTVGDIKSSTDNAFQSSNLGDAVDIVSGLISANLIYSQAQATATQAAKAADTAETVKAGAQSDLGSAALAKAAADGNITTATNALTAAQSAVITASDASAAANGVVTSIASTIATAQSALKLANDGKVATDLKLDTAIAGVVTAQAALDAAIATTAAANKYADQLSADSQAILEAETAAGKANSIALDALYNKKNITKAAQELVDKTANTKAVSEYWLGEAKSDKISAQTELTNLEGTKRLADQKLAEATAAKDTKQVALDAANTAQAKAEADLIKAKAAESANPDDPELAAATAQAQAAVDAAVKTTTTQQGVVKSAQTIETNAQNHVNQVVGMMEAAAANLAAASKKEIDLQKDLTTATQALPGQQAALDAAKQAELVAKLANDEAYKTYSDLHEAQKVAYAAYNAAYDAARATDSNITTKTSELATAKAKLTIAEQNAAGPSAKAAAAQQALNDAITAAGIAEVKAAAAAAELAQKTTDLATAQALVQAAHNAAAAAAADVLTKQTALDAANAALDTAKQAINDAHNSLTEAQAGLDAANQNKGDVLDQLAAELLKGNDTITVTSTDTSLIHAGAGDDRVTGNIGDDVLYGDDGNDTLNGGTGSDQLYGGTGNDKLYGGDGNDQLFGDEGNDLLDGGNGNDFLYGGAGNDTLLGGAGNDWLEGGAGDDVLDGGAGNDILLGGDGKDILKGGAGNDILIGGAGQDTLSGGVGRDLFIFNADDSIADADGKGIDTITDFNVNEDSIAFNHLDLNNGSVKTLTTGNGANASYASLLEAANALFLSSNGEVKAVIGYDKGNAYVFVDTDGLTDANGKYAADTAIKLVGVKGDLNIGAIHLVGGDYAGI